MGYSASFPATRYTACTIGRAYPEAVWACAQAPSAVINAAEQTRIAIHAAASVVGSERVCVDVEPVMGSEDFAFMLEAKPGAYVFLGQAGSPNPCMIHNPHYDFDDRLLPIGSSIWVSLVRQELPLG